MISEAEYKTFHEEGSKILTHRQMLQRLPIAVAQVIAGIYLKTFKMKSINSHILYTEQK